jgi:hypothetical protein
MILCNNYGLVTTSDARGRTHRLMAALSWHSHRLHRSPSGKPSWTGSRSSHKWKLYRRLRAEE